MIGGTFSGGLGSVIVAARSVRRARTTGVSTGTGAGGGGSVAGDGDGDTTGSCAGAGGAGAVCAAVVIGVAGGASMPSPPRRD
jgi:hypothetical protein